MEDPLENPRMVAITLAEEKRILYLQVLLIIVGRLDIALLMTDFAQKHCLVHLHQVANCVFTIVVFDDISDVEKHELLTVVRSWRPEAKIVFTKWVCQTWLQKVGQMKACTRCLQHMGSINSILKDSIHHRGRYMLRWLNDTREISVEMCDAGCEKCSTIDHHLPGILYTVREALNEFNILKRNIKKSKETQISHRVLLHSDAHAKGKRTINDFRSGVQKIVSPTNCWPKCLT
ncbi:uncharacterized protein LOC127853788 isoform X2 [Dreissena polymorpha]|uniref:Uncharacterized protein n=2 Tax=Dreissena polymorpha TaxID=45954 RepID=A0A9D4CIP9_DREPO|nr:uncharacterized protein LOC127853788 isoform X2 [Dreissena polymorpha]XP_052244518.1 uncharacterized protein LOC127853788 isoform X2 [Dreissena polymorpha]KAH3725227.1 hypothetical protein DPMN_051062 [Dreissena polymorpha]